MATHKELEIWQLSVIRSKLIKLIKYLKALN